MQVARVAVDDERWIAFRQAALAQGTSISGYLARLVEAELSRRSGRAVATVDPEAQPANQAIGALPEVRASIEELDAIAGRLARTAVAHGGPWADVGSTLRVTPEAARSAYAQET